MGAADLPLVINQDLAAVLSHPAYAGMRAVDQWIVWRLDPPRDAGGKNVKTPTDRRGWDTDAHNAANWSNAAKALADATRLGPRFGVGYVFTPGGYWFLDLDGCHDGKAWSQFAITVVQHYFPGAAVEVSSSGNGLHLFGSGTVPPHRSRRDDLGAELYTEARFAAVTGLRAQGDCNSDHTGMMQWFAQHYFPPREAHAVHGDGPRADWRGPTGDADLIRRALQSRSGASKFGGGRASFADLWERNVAVLAQAYPPDRSSSEPYNASSADAALAAHLCFWSGCDAERVEHLMRQSGLRRDKYERSDYLSRTITNAISLQKEVLQDKPMQPPPAPVAPDAPTMRAAEGERFLSAAAQAELFKGCVYVVDQHRALVPGGTLLKPDQFRAKFGGYTFAMDSRNERTSRNAWEAFTESQVLTAPRADGTCFRPQLPYGAIVESEGRTRANTYWPIDVHRVAGSVEPFERHLKLLLPSDWHVLLYFMAGVVQFPGVKFQWMPLLIGVEGNGKTFFSECLSRAVGKRYTHWVAADKIAAQFNEWLFGKLFYPIEDLKIGHNAAAWEKLKPLITGENVEIEGKGVDQRSDEICGNFISNSNHFDAVRATRNDRRVAHLHCAQQTVDDLARDGIDERYTSALYGWAKNQDGYAKVAEYLHTMAIPPEFGRGWLTGRAPNTTARAAAIEHGRSPVEQALLDAIEEERPGFGGGWVSSVMAEKLIEGRRMLGQFPRAGRESILRGLGYVRHPALAANKGRVSHVVMPDGAKPTLYVREGHQALAIQTGAEVARAYTTAQGGL